MGRRVPIENLSLIHPAIYLTFFAAGLAASMAIITALCSVRFRRKASAPPEPAQEVVDPSPSNTSKTENSNSNEEQEQEQEQEQEVKELPLPPALQQLPKDPFISERMKRVTSERKMPLSLSIKMPRSLTVARNWDHHKENKEKENKGSNLEGKLKAEDSVWMKTIILGEKCNPDEDDDPVIFEGRGKRIEAYHTKRYSAMSMSNQDPLTTSVFSVPQSRSQDDIAIINTKTSY